MYKLVWEEPASSTIPNWGQNKPRTCQRYIILLHIELATERTQKTGAFRNRRRKYFNSWWSPCQDFNWQNFNKSKTEKAQKTNEIILNHTPLFSSEWQIYANTNKNITIMLVVVLLTVVSCYFHHQFGKKVLIEKSFQQIDWKKPCRPINTRFLSSRKIEPVLWQCNRI